MGRRGRIPLGLGTRTIGEWHWYVPSTGERVEWAVQILPPERNERPKFRVYTPGRQGAGYASYEGTDLFKLEEQARDDTYARAPLDWEPFLRVLVEQSGDGVDEDGDMNINLCINVERIEAAVRPVDPNAEDEEQNTLLARTFWRKVGSTHVSRGDPRYDAYYVRSDKPRYVVIPHTPENYDALMSIVNGMERMGERLSQVMSQKNIKKTLAGVQANGIKLLTAPEPAQTVKPKKVKAKVLA